jgi:hypothetical protein
MTKLKSELDKITTGELIRYVVSEEECDAACAVVEKFKGHPAASQLLRDYYLSLHEADDEMAVDIRVVAEKNGTFLFGLKTTSHRYYYICTEEEAVYLGDFDHGIQDSSILRFFGFKSSPEFTAAKPDNYDDLPALNTGTGAAVSSACVACGVSEGEVHILGCPVEQCPWCAEQLNRCNCRFEKLGVDAIEDEDLLDSFQELLEQQGRIVFKAGQNPSYPTAGSDPGPGKTAVEG